MLSGATLHSPGCAGTSISCRRSEGENKRTHFHSCLTATLMRLTDMSASYIIRAERLPVRGRGGGGSSSFKTGLKFNAGAWNIPHLSRAKTGGPDRRGEASRGEGRGGEGSNRAATHGSVSASCCFRNWFEVSLVHKVPPPPQRRLPLISSLDRNAQILPCLCFKSSQNVPEEIWRGFFLFFFFLFFCLLAVEHPLCGSESNTIPRDTEEEIIIIKKKNYLFKVFILLCFLWSIKNSNSDNGEWRQLCALNVLRLMRKCCAAFSRPTLFIPPSTSSHLFKHEISWLITGWSGIWTPTWSDEVEFGVEIWLLLLLCNVAEKKKNAPS